MNKKQLIILTALPLTVFLGNLLLHQGLVGFDGYAFALGICGGTALPGNTPLLAAALMPLLPCNEFAWKLLGFAVLLACVLITAKIGELFQRERGWLAGLFPFMASAYFMEFLKFEDDLLAFPLLALATYFYLKGVKERKRAAQFVATGLVFLALGFWRGSIIYFFALSGFWVNALVAIGLLIFLLKDFIGSIVVLNSVKENAVLVGLEQYWGLSCGVVGLRRAWLWPLAFFLLFTALNFKFFIHAVPFLAVGLIGVVKNRPQLLRIFVMLSVFICLLTVARFPDLPPTAENWEAIEYWHDYRPDLPHKNYWDWGHWIDWRFGEGAASMKSGYGYQEFSGAIVISDVELPCKTVEEFRPSTKIYWC